jgi:succinoglycan biosynthesis protein ExoA
MGVMPFVSVMIPVRNEQRYIEGCLRSLLQSQYPPTRWEILVVDGMSDDGTRECVQRLQTEAPVPILLLDNPRRITPVAMNLALAHARGSLLIRADAHALYPEDYVSLCVTVLLESGADNVGGPIRTCPGAATPMAEAIALATSHPFGVGNSAFRTRRTAREVDTVPFGCFHLDLFKRLGLFDERLVRTQDFEFNQRIRRAGGRILLDERLESTYFSRRSFQGLVYKGWANGFWNAMAHHLHPHSRCLRHVVPMGFALGVWVAVGMGIWAWGWGLPRWGWGVAALVWAIYALYVLLTLGVATSLARRHGGRVWPYLLILFPAFHLAFGSGLLWGELRVQLHAYPWQDADGIPTWDERCAPPAYWQHQSSPAINIAQSAHLDPP